MRISDWSSDVCSSDLSPSVGRVSEVVMVGPEYALRRRLSAQRRPGERPHTRRGKPRRRRRSPCGCRRRRRVLSCCSVLLGRSEEHTSELQSLMRISYAVFFLKKNHYNTSLLSITILYLIYSFLSLCITL